MTPAEPRELVAAPDQGDEVLPPLPAEKHLVQSVIAFTEVESRTKALLWLMQRDPRSAAVVTALNEVDQAFLQGYRAYSSFVEIISCKGRA